MFESGAGVQRDYAQAYNWYVAAALQNDAEAQYRLAMIHASAMGVPRDDGEAYAWLTVAIENGHKQAMEAREDLSEGMTRNQIAQARELAQDKQKLVAIQADQ